MSNLELGNSFEAQVARLLRSSTGYKNVREQQHIRGKNVDIVFQKQWNPHRYLTIAVECKNWKSGIDRQTIKDMYFDYKPLLDHRDIDELWIVTPTPVGPTVQEHVDSFKGIEVLHISELEQDIIDFSLYATSLRDRFNNDTLSKYYIASRLEGSDITLDSKISTWLKSSSEHPIAVWAGYGMGKTSYAAFLASKLATQYLSDPTERIPILIPLGDYYTSPRLDGLFANTLTRDNGVHGYNFNTFWNLHEGGRFVIILDGFDEMKHAMTKGEFAAISKEIRKLILPNSKILLLGRPDAIVTGEEHAALMKGTRRMLGLEIQDNISAEFEEVRLDFFSKPEYIDFLKRYIDCFYKSKDKAIYVNRRVQEIENLGVDDLIKRPVQARMLAQILLNPKNSIEKISRYELYNTFIEDCMTREEEKPERRKLESTTRKRFMQDLSWWLWAFKRTRTFTVSDIPTAITQKFVAADQDPVGQLRELLVGSLVEEQSIGSILNEKDAGTFYFPHLSFTEFLVAEYLIERELKEADIAILSQSLDGEIKSFIRGYKNQDGVLKLFDDLKHYRGSLPWNFIQFISESETLRRRIGKSLEHPIRNIWQFSVEFLVMLQLTTADGLRKKDIRNKGLGKCASIIGADDYRSTLIATQLLLKAIINAVDVRQSIADLFVGTIFRGMNIDKLADTTRSPAIEYRITTDTEDLFVTLLSRIRIVDDFFHFNAAELFLCTEDEDDAITDALEQQPIEIQVSIQKVSDALRTNHDKRRFDQWHSRLKNCTIFDQNRASWETAKRGLY
jgi:hypothetical protein